jgi:hypothetical protein
MEAAAIDVPSEVRFRLPSPEPPPQPKPAVSRQPPAAPEDPSDLAGWIQSMGSDEPMCGPADWSVADLLQWTRRGWSQREADSLAEELKLLEQTPAGKSYFVKIARLVQQVSSASGGLGASPAVRAAVAANGLFELLADPSIEAGSSLHTVSRILGLRLLRSLCSTVFVPWAVAPLPSVVAARTAAAEELAATAVQAEFRITRGAHPHGATASSAASSAAPGLNTLLVREVARTHSALGKVSDLVHNKLTWAEAWSGAVSSGVAAEAMAAGEGRRAIARSAELEAKIKLRAQRLLRITARITLLQKRRRDQQQLALLNPRRHLSERFTTLPTTEQRRLLVTLAKTSKGGMSGITLLRMAVTLSPAQRRVFFTGLGAWLKVGDSTLLDALEAAFLASKGLEASGRRTSSLVPDVRAEYQTMMKEFDEDAKKASLEASTRLVDAKPVKEAFWMNAEWKQMVQEEEEALLNLEWLIEQAGSLPNGNGLGFDESLADISATMDGGTMQAMTGAVSAAVTRSLTKSFIPALEKARSHAASNVLTSLYPSSTTGDASDQQGDGSVRSRLVYNADELRAMARRGVMSPALLGASKTGRAGGGGDKSLPFVLRGRVLLEDSRPMLEAARAVAGDNDLRERLRTVIDADDEAETLTRRDVQHIAKDDAEASGMGNTRFAKGGFWPKSVPYIGPNGETRGPTAPASTTVASAAASLESQTLHEDSRGARGRALRKAAVALRERADENKTEPEQITPTKLEAKTEDNGSLIADLKRVVTRGREARIALQEMHQRARGLERRVAGLLWRITSLRALVPLRTRKATRAGMRMAAVLQSQRGLFGDLPLAPAAVDSGTFPGMFGSGGWSTTVSTLAAAGYGMDGPSKVAIRVRMGADALANKAQPFSALLPAPITASVATVPSWAFLRGYDSWGALALGGYGFPGGLAAGQHRTSLPTAKPLAILAGREVLSRTTAALGSLLALSSAHLSEALDELEGAAPGQSSGRHNRAGVGLVPISFEWLVQAMSATGSVSVSRLMDDQVVRRRRRACEQVARKAWLGRAQQQALVEAGRTSISSIPVAGRAMALTDMAAASDAASQWPVVDPGRTGLESRGGAAAHVAWMLSLDGIWPVGHMGQVLTPAAQRGGSDSILSLTSINEDASASSFLNKYTGKPASRSAAPKKQSPDIHVPFQSRATPSAMDSPAAVQDVSRDALARWWDGEPQEAMPWLHGLHATTANSLLRSSHEMFLWEKQEAQADLWAEAVLASAASGTGPSSASPAAAFDRALVAGQAWSPLQWGVVSSKDASSLAKVFLTRGKHLSASLGRTLKPLVPVTTIGDLATSSAVAWKVRWGPLDVRRRSKEEPPSLSTLHSMPIGADTVAPYAATRTFLSNEADALLQLEHLTVQVSAMDDVLMSSVVGSSPDAVVSPAPRAKPSRRGVPEAPPRGAIDVESMLEHVEETDETEAGSQRSSVPVSGGVVRRRPRRASVRRGSTSSVTSVAEEMDDVEGIIEGGTAQVLGERWPKAWDPDSKDDAISSNNPLSSLPSSFPKVSDAGRAERADWSDAFPGGKTLLLSSMDRNGLIGALPLTGSEQVSDVFLSTVEGSGSSSEWEPELLELIGLSAADSQLLGRKAVQKVIVSRLRDAMGLPSSLNRPDAFFAAAPVAPDSVQAVRKRVAEAAIEANEGAIARSVHAPLAAFRSSSSKPAPHARSRRGSRVTSPRSLDAPESSKITGNSERDVKRRKRQVERSWVCLPACPPSTVVRSSVRKLLSAGFGRYPPPAILNDVDRSDPSWGMVLPLSAPPAVLSSAKPARWVGLAEPAAVRRAWLRERHASLIAWTIPTARLVPVPGLLLSILLQRARESVEDPRAIRSEARKFLMDLHKTADSVDALPSVPALRIEPLPVPRSVHRQTVVARDDLSAGETAELTVSSDAQLVAECAVAAEAVLAGDHSLLKALRPSALLLWLRRRAAVSASMARLARNNTLASGTTSSADRATGLSAARLAGSVGGLFAGAGSGIAVGLDSGASKIAAAQATQLANSAVSNLYGGGLGGWTALCAVASAGPGLAGAAAEPVTGTAPRVSAKHHLATFADAVQGIRRLSVAASEEGAATIQALSVAAGATVLSDGWASLKTAKSSVGKSKSSGDVPTWWPTQPSLSRAKIAGTSSPTESSAAVLMSALGGSETAWEQVVKNLTTVWGDKRSQLNAEQQWGSGVLPSALAMGAEAAHAALARGAVLGPALASRLPYSEGVNSHVIALVLLQEATQRHSHLVATRSLGFAAAAETRAWMQGRTADNLTQYAEGVGAGDAEVLQSPINVILGRTGTTDARAKRRKASGTVRRPSTLVLPSSTRAPPGAASMAGADQSSVVSTLSAPSWATGCLRIGPAGSVIVAGLPPAPLLAKAATLANAANLPTLLALFAHALTGPATGWASSLPLTSALIPDASSSPHNVFRLFTATPCNWVTRRSVATTASMPSSVTSGAFSTAASVLPASSGASSLPSISGSGTTLSVSGDVAVVAAMAGVAQALTRNLSTSETVRDAVLERLRQAVAWWRKVRALGSLHVGVKLGDDELRGVAQFVDASGGIVSWGLTRIVRQSLRGRRTKPQASDGTPKEPPSTKKATDEFFHKSESESFAGPVERLLSRQRQRRAQWLAANSQEVEAGPSANQVLSAQKLLDEPELGVEGSTVFTLAPATSLDMAAVLGPPPVDGDTQHIEPAPRSQEPSSAEDDENSLDSDEGHESDADDDSHSVRTAATGGRSRGKFPQHWDDADEGRAQSMLAASLAWPVRRDSEAVLSGDEAGDASRAAKPLVAPPLGEKRWWPRCDDGVPSLHVLHEEIAAFWAWLVGRGGIQCPKDLIGASGSSQWVEDSSVIELLATTPEAVKAQAKLWNDPANWPIPPTLLCAAHGNKTAEFLLETAKERLNASVASDWSFAKGVRAHPSDVIRTQVDVDASTVSAGGEEEGDEDDEVRLFLPGMHGSPVSLVSHLFRLWLVETWTTKVSREEVVASNSVRTMIEAAEVALLSSKDSGRRGSAVEITESVVWPPPLLKHRAQMRVHKRSGAIASQLGQKGSKATVGVSASSLLQEMLAKSVESEARRCVQAADRRAALFERAIVRHAAMSPRVRVMGLLGCYTELWEASEGGHSEATKASLLREFGPIGVDAATAAGISVLQRVAASREQEKLPSEHQDDQNRVLLLSGLSSFKDAEAKTLDSANLAPAELEHSARSLSQRTLPPLASQAALLQWFCSLLAVVVDVGVDAVAGNTTDPRVLAGSTAARQLSSLLGTGVRARPLERGSSPTPARGGEGERVSSRSSMESVPGLVGDAGLLQRNAALGLLQFPTGVTGVTAWRVMRVAVRCVSSTAGTTEWLRLSASAVATRPEPGAVAAAMAGRTQFGVFDQPGTERMERRRRHSQLLRSAISNFSKRSQSSPRSGVSGRRRSITEATGYMAAEEEEEEDKSPSGERRSQSQAPRRRPASDHRSPPMRFDAVHDNAESRAAAVKEASKDAHGVLGDIKAAVTAESVDDVHSVMQRLQAGVLHSGGIVDLDTAVELLLSARMACASAMMLGPLDVWDE